MNEIKISVKDIVELIYGGGDLVNEKSLLLRAEEGTKAHQYLQAKYKDQDQKEVVVGYDGIINDTHYILSGRIDGLLKRGSKTIVEEIKSTYMDLDSLDDTTIPAHIAQAKMYAYLYIIENKKKVIYIRLTYISVDSYKTKTIENKYTLQDLEAFFNQTIKEYQTFVNLLSEHESKRNKSIEGLNFPFNEYRAGQRELMRECYLNVINKNILYAVAPTGIGKTIATLYSTLKAINDSKQKVFYLTAKNAGKNVAMDTMKLLMSKGLIAKTVEITAKDTVCFMETRDCDKDKCIYANGYYHRLYPAIKDIYAHETIFSKDVIKEYAIKHQLCPFEFSLDISNYSDVIIGDYNYAFCPRIHLIRYFESDNFKPILLVDEAHNLISRSRDMYSSKLSRNMILSLINKVKSLKPSPMAEINSILDQFKTYESELVNVEYTVRKYYDDIMVGLCRKLLVKIDQILSTKEPIIFKAEILKIYFELIRFTKTSEFYKEENFIYALEKTENDIIGSIECLDASNFLLDVMNNRSYGTILFSATLSPLSYYQKLLTQDQGNSIVLPSPFNPYHLKLIMVDNMSTRYNDRQNSIERIVNIINILASSKQGNYIVFFPSYAYLNMTKQVLQEKYPEFNYIVQEKGLTIKEKDEYINLFKTEITKSQIGLFVMGGMFAEGIDYIGDMLSGVVVVGCGLPMFGGYNNMLKSYFDRLLGGGFDYAYTYPGFGKVVQAVGRVIRTKTDRGVAILIDDRFTTNKYKYLYPKEWSHFQVINSEDYLKEELNNFWNESTK
jgi:DNA excision repair protein ERCC-2